MNYGGGKTWDQQSTPEMKLQAAKAFSQPPPAIVQQVKDLTYFRQRLKELSQKLEHDARAYRETVKEFKESGIWQPVHKTWAQACRAELHISPQRAHKLLAELTELYALENQPPLDQVAAIEDKYLSQVEDNRPANQPIEPESKPQVEAYQPPKDDLGRIIPQRCIDLVSRAEADLQPIISAASKIQALFKKLSADDTHKPDSLFAFLHQHLHECTDHAHRIFRALSCCKPERVCPKCDANNEPHTCDVCFGSGMVSEYFWTHRIINGSDPYLADKAKAIENHVHP